MSTRHKKRFILRIVTGVLLLALGVGISFASQDSGGGYAGGDFQKWAGHLLKVVSQLEDFIQIVATLAGMWFVFSGLNMFRKYHTSQGAQGEHVKNGMGHIMVGIFLMCLVPAIQMLQSTIMTGAGDSGKQTFTVDSNALNSNNS
ncbi:hypothetical protein [Facilibium subflavum]|uniref:hypothetical protein n=1 Tax=Facilibium subflavum TaxID=2219058 RepID=UPI000E651AA6|nr:hypothetical protein [Facilibium subflavum]